MKTDGIHIQRLRWAAVAGIGALLLASGVLLLLSRFQVLAQPAVAVADGDLLVSKEVNTSLAAPGDTLYYTITIQDMGSHAPMMVQLTDTLPAELDYVNASLSCPFFGSSCSAEGDVITWTAQMYGGGQTASIYFSADITADITCATVINTAQVATDTLVHEASATTVVAGSVGNLVVTKSASEGTVEPGDIVTYTITVRDATIPAGIVWLTDTLPADLSYVNGSLSCPFYGGSCGIENDVITWTAQMYGGNQTADISFSTQISSGITSNQWITNTVDVNALCQSRTASAGVYVYLGTPTLEAHKSVYPQYARPGENLAYTVLIRNIGDGVAGDVWMTDALPVELDYASGLNATTGQWGVSGDIITWTGSLDPAEAVTITFGTSIVSTISNNTPFVNTAQITGDGGPVTASVEARAITTFTLRFPLVYKNFPPTTILNPIPAPDSNHSYVVSWQPVDGATSYLLQESTSAAFSTIAGEWPVTAPTVSRSFTKSASGTFYYRVRPDGSWGPGVWSNVRSVVVYIDPGFYDEFTDATSGWPNESGIMYEDNSGNPRRWYRDYRVTGSGEYRIRIDQGGPLAWFYQPYALAPYIPPSDKFCIETKARFTEVNYWANMGVVIGSQNENKNAETKFYAFCLARGSGGDRLGWFLMMKNDYLFPRRGCTGPTYKVDGENNALGTSKDGWNNIKLGVNGDQVKVYIDNIYKGEFTLSGLSVMTRVGLIAGDYELTPIESRFEYFRVIPNSDCH